MLGNSTSFNSIKPLKSIKMEPTEVASQCDEHSLLKNETLQQDQSLTQFLTIIAICKTN